MIENRLHCGIISGFDLGYTRGMGLERELKLTGPLPNLNGLEQLGGHGLRFDRLEVQRNTYFDTATFELRSRRWSLRLRQLENSSIFTFKGKSQVSNGFAEREEIEIEVLNATTLEELRDPEILARVTQIAPITEFKPVAQLETKRLIYQLENIGEVTLDDVRVLNSSGNLVEQFTEVEIELEDRVDPILLEPVLKHLRELSPLEPSTMGKFQRAMRALELQ
jgi:predicted adenylyl cyclase CyaB